MSCNQSEEPDVLDEDCCGGCPDECCCNCGAKDQLREQVNDSINRRH